MSARYWVSQSSPAPLKRAYWKLPTWMEAEGVTVNASSSSTAAPGAIDGRRFVVASSLAMWPLTTALIASTAGAAWLLLAWLLDSAWLVAWLAALFESRSPSPRPDGEPIDETGVTKLEGVTWHCLGVTKLDGVAWHSPGCTGARRGRA
jgi:hypothetical protein